MCTKDITDAWWQCVKNKRTVTAANWRLGWNIGRPLFWRPFNWGVLSKLLVLYCIINGVQTLVRHEPNTHRTWTPFFALLKRSALQIEHLQPSSNFGPLCDWHTHVRPHYWISIRHYPRPLPTGNSFRNCALPARFSLHLTHHPPTEKTHAHPSEKIIYQSDISIVWSPQRFSVSPSRIACRDVQFSVEWTNETANGKTKPTILAAEGAGHWSSEGAEVANMCAAHMNY